jgi:hypothetical protein
VSAKKSFLEPVRARVRRLQFTVGLGFVSLMLGSIISGSLAIRLSQRLADVPSVGVRMLVGVLMGELWVLLVLPALCYGAARIVELRPLSTALGGALSGQFFVLSLLFVREGALYSSAGWRVELLRWLAFAGGVVISYRAVQHGRAVAEQRAAQVRAQAESKKSEYDEFLRQAELDGERAAQREAQRAAAAAGVSTEAPAPAAAPVAAAPAEAPAPAPVVSMTPATAEAPAAPEQAGEAASKATGS